MKRALYLSALLLGLSLGASAQQTEVRKKKAEHSFYRRSLDIDSAKAEQVAAVQRSYKAGLNSAVSDTSLSEAGKREKIRQLADEKNRKLRLLLSPSQQEKIIPTSERGTGPKKH